MKIELKKFESGWVGLSLAVTRGDIDLLIQRLSALKSGDIGHFHLRTNNFDGDPSVADVEIFSTTEEDMNFSVE